MNLSNVVCSFSVIFWIVFFRLLIVFGNVKFLVLILNIGYFVLINLLKFVSCLFFIFYMIKNYYREMYKYLLLNLKFVDIFEKWLLLFDINFIIFVLYCKFYCIVWYRYYKVNVR